MLTALLQKPISKGLFHNIIFKMNKSTPKIYRTTNWSSYNRALINRGNIAIWFDPATQWYAPSKANKDEIKLTPTQLSNAA